MFFEMVLILAMTFYGELSYNNPDRVTESQLIYQTAKNRAEICNTDIPTELLKEYQYSSQNDSNCKPGKRCLNIKKENVNLYSQRLSDVFKILLYPNNKDVLFFHAKSMTLEETGQDKDKMFLLFDKNEHLYYGSTDTHFCNAKPYKRKNKYYKKQKKPMEKKDPLEDYRKKLKGYMKNR